MLISSIVIGIAYYAFLLFNQQFGSYQRKSGVVGEYFLLRKAMQNDFEKADVIKDSANSFLILQTNSDSRRVIYKIDSNIIVRNIDEATDSFKVKCNKLSFIHENDNFNLVKEIYFETKLDNSTWGCNIRKRYSAVQYMAAEKLQYE